MRKRKQRLHQRTIQTNQSISHSSNIPHQFIDINFNHQQLTPWYQSNPNPPTQHSQPKPQQTQKSCLQQTLSKITTYFQQLINYLQFDRIITKQQFQSLHKQSYIIKTKHHDNYYLTYQQRSKTFGISLQQIAKLKQQQQRKNNKNFWMEFKKFICCQGADQLEQTDQVLTAVSQSQFFCRNVRNRNINRNKNNNKHKDIVELTQQALIDDKNHSLFPRSNKMIRQQQQQYQFNPTNQNIFQISKYKGTNNKIEQQGQQKQKDDQRIQNKKIDMNNIRNIQKRQNRIKQNIKNVKNTQTILIHQNANVNKDQSYQQQNNQSSLNNTSSNKKYKILYKQAKSTNLQGKQANRQDVGSNKQDKREEIQLNSEISQVDDKRLISRKQSETTLSAVNNHLSSMQNSRKPSLKQLHTLDQSSNQQLTNAHNPQPQNIFNQSQLGSSYIHNDSTQIRSIHHQAQQQIRQESQNVKLSQYTQSNKINKRKNKKKIITQSLNHQDLHIDMKFSQNYDINQQNSNRNQQNSTKLPQQQVSLSNNQTKKHPNRQKSPHSTSLSSHQLGKHKKNRLKLNEPNEYENGYEFTIDQNEQDDKQRQNNTNLNNERNQTMSQRRGQSQQKTNKKKKIRNKKLFTQQQNNNQMVIFPQNQQHYSGNNNNKNNQNNIIEQSQQQNKVSRTISFNNDNTSNRVSQTLGIKKRKKNKKLTQLITNNKNDEQIVIQTDQIFQLNDNNNLITNQIQFNQNIHQQQLTQYNNRQSECHIKQRQYNNNNNFNINNKQMTQNYNINKGQKKKKRKNKLQQSLKYQNQLNVIHLGELN